MTHVPCEGSGQARADLVSGQIAEAGVKGYEATLWLGLLGPEGLPAEVVTRLNVAFAKLAKNLDFEQPLGKVGTDVVYRAQQQWEAYL